MALKEVILTFFYFGQEMLFLKEVILTVSAFGGCSGHERTYFEQILFWEGVMVLKELILTISTLGRKWWF